MKRQIIYLLLACLMTVYSCKKDKSKTPSGGNKSTKDLLIGEWIITHEASDDNNNETLEDSEKEIRDGNYHLRFDSDGNAIRTYPANPSNWYNYTWTLDGNTLTLKEGNNPAVTLTIETITETELKYRYKEDFTARTQWRIYKK